MVNAATNQGMGAIVHDAGVAFRVWAPNAEAVEVTGGFDDWSEDGAPMSHEGDGTWYVEVPGARAGDEYRFVIRNGDMVLSRIDPYARAVTTSVGNGIVRRTTGTAPTWRCRPGTGW
jgi:1,4-alpha-glucan branching enzyme